MSLPTSECQETVNMASLKVTVKTLCSLTSKRTFGFLSLLHLPLSGRSLPVPCEIDDVPLSVQTRCRKIRVKKGITKKHAAVFHVAIYLERWEIADKGNHSFNYCSTSSQKDVSYSYKMIGMKLC